MTTLIIVGSIIALIGVVVLLAIQYGKVIIKVDNHETQGKTRRRAESVRAAAKRDWLRKNKR